MNRASAVAVMLLLGVSWLSGAALDPISHAEACGRCHRDILEAWKQSVHATAMKNPLFQDVLERAEAVAGASVRKTCLGCHAPTVRYSGDDALRLKASWEGVTCDFCHSVKSVQITAGIPRYNVKFDGVKTGPLGEASSPVHGTAFSNVHTTSLVCAGCHEYSSTGDFHVLSTYSEWSESRYGKEGIHCQQCHMGEEAGHVVDPKIKRLPRGVVNLHSMPGSRSVDQLNRAIRLRLDTDREGDELLVKAELKNRGAGHMVPTGSPLRQITLIVEVSAGGRFYSDQRIYGQRVADSNGKELNREELVFLRSAQRLEDTRLKPDEVREEVFRFDVPAARSARVKATLSYHYAPREGDPYGTSLNFLVLPSYVPAERTAR